MSITPVELSREPLISDLTNPTPLKSSHKKQRWRDTHALRGHARHTDQETSWSLAEAEYRGLWPDLHEWFGVTQGAVKGHTLPKEFSSLNYAEFKPVDIFKGLLGTGCWMFADPRMGDDIRNLRFTGALKHCLEGILLESRKDPQGVMRIIPAHRSSESFGGFLTWERLRGKFFIPLLCPTPCALEL